MERFLLSSELMFLGVLSAAIVFLFWLTIDTRIKWIRLFGKKAPPDGKLLEDVLSKISRIDARLEKSMERIGVMEHLSAANIRKVGFLRFNPFRDTGGDQSFSLALLDNEDNGVVLLSLYTREGVRLYAKSIHSGKAKQPLSDEEETVLAEAIQK